MKYEYLLTLHNFLQDEDMLLFEKAVELSNAPSHGTYFNSVAEFISTWADSDQIIIGKILPQNQVRTLVYTNKNEVLPNVTYSTKGTPCENTLQLGICYYPFDVQLHFPEDECLTHLNLESYLGTAVTDASGEAVGIIALLHTKPIENAALKKELFTILGPRLEEELKKVNYPSQVNSR
ncbi:MAG: hypothetical protein LPJ89_09950 [Hymenobacteraceae bacterium]|nr:hypothetical protein [Hymenobacteraceae bacterium]MDX5396134.1 hypothetical protein [Hymenobacteraceae bacterium]MDX5444090.1 hypothetical protein [Hymenobacteraceae bacterium]MDX5512195.1 hypothetical protein [Hymenobacteraceae bacterium]